MKITRRQVLAAAAAVPVAGGLAAAGVGWQWWDRPAGQGLTALSSEEHGFVQALAEAWMPAGGRPALSGADAQIGDFFDGVIAAMHPQTGRELKLLLHALDHLTVPTRLRPFQALGREVRSTVLAGWLDHPVMLVRDGVSAVMVLVGVGWTTHPEVVPVLRRMFPCGYGR